MTDALSQIRTRNAQTPQTEQADERQVQNNAGGYVFEVAGEDRIKRFLTLGVQGGTYYQRENPYTKENAKFVIDFAKAHGVKLVDLIHEISVAGRAPKQNPTLFALAAVFAFGDISAKQDAQNVFNAVVRTGTHLFIFVKYAEQFRGWGRGLKKAVGSWYLDKDARELSYQLVKYRQREDWTHRDVLRSAHVGWKTAHVDDDIKMLFKWVTHPEHTQILPADTWVGPYLQAQALAGSSGDKSKAYAKLVQENPGMSWEMLPDEALKVPAVWEALVGNNMPITALIRNLPRLTTLGLLTGATGTKVAKRLTDADLLRKGRVHPVKLLYAMKTYASGHSVKGSSSWAPVRKITDALDAAFYMAFKTVEPAGKRTLIGMDVSGSMHFSSDGVVTCAEGAMAMAMVTAATEPDYEIMGFADQFRRLDISPRRRLDDNLTTIRGMSFGSTDCSLPMVWAKQEKREFDTFIVYTDNETYAGREHPHQALKRYRQQSGIDARLIVVGMTATDFTIADPNDPRTLDVAGFDADTPSVISGFSRGDFG